MYTLHSQGKEHFFNATRTAQVDIDISLCQVMRRQKCRSARSGRGVHGIAGQVVLSKFMPEIPDKPSLEVIEKGGS